MMAADGTKGEAGGAIGLGLLSTMFGVKNGRAAKAFSWTGKDPLELAEIVADGTLTVKPGCEMLMLRLAENPNAGLLALALKVKFCAGTVKLKPGWLKEKFLLKFVVPKFIPPKKNGELS
jgi:hypothetical protein